MTGADYYGLSSCCVNVGKPECTCRTPRTFTGTTANGVPVCVTVHDAEGVADLAFKYDGRWGVPIELSEETA